MGRCFMDEAKADLVKSWLLKAAHDLGAAVKLSAGEEAYLDVAIYHCQQAAEKAVKAFLVHGDQEFGKTHDLESLVSAAAELDARFSSWVDLVDSLTPYATAYRYPSDQLEPDLAEFQEALGTAQAFFDFVLSLLPKEVYPCSSLQRTGF